MSAIALPDLFRWLNYLLLCLFPVAIYWSTRRFGFARSTAAAAGLTAPLLATDGLYGFDDASYVWSGFGLYAQLWGMLLLPVALVLSLALALLGTLAPLRLALRLDPAAVLRG